MATLDSLLPSVGVQVLGTPVPVILHAIRTAAQEFCQETRVWMVGHTVPVVAGQSRYLIPADDQAALVVLEEITLNGEPLVMESPDRLKERWIHWQTVTGTPQVVACFDPEALTLVPKPVAAGTLWVRAAYQPDWQATEVPDWLFAQYARTIALGAQALLMDNKGLTCFDPNEAQAKRTAFVALMGQAQRHADRGWTRARRRVKGRYF